MRTMKNQKVALGFTIVELLVVIGIIGILVALLIPAVTTVRNSAKKLKTQSTMTAIEAGLEAYRNATGEPYPPSGSDHQVNPWKITSPYSPPASTTPVYVAVTGANMLVYALAGADLQGTAGFKDVSRPEDANSPGFWNNLDNIQDCIGGNNGLYALDYGCGGGEITLDPLHRRFGPFLDINKTDITNMRDYAEDVLLPRNNYAQSVPLPTGGVSTDPDDYLKQPFILDGFGFPILYYKASVGASGMMMDPVNGSSGIYDPLDNALYVGAIDDSNNYAPDGGMDLGAGKNHPLRFVNAPSVRPSGQDSTDLSAPDWQGTFANLIWDRKVTARNAPVNKDSYILISPGADALWGTDDDITNFNQ